MSSLVVAALLALWTILFFASTSCSKKDDSENIRQLVKQGVKLAEEHDIVGLMKHTTEDFLANPGQHDRRRVRAILFRAFNYYREFKIVYPRPIIELAAGDESASARVYFLIVRKDISMPALDRLYNDPKGWLEEVGENADLYRLTLELLKKKGNWLVKLTLLESFTGTGFSE
jgi:hypothetical protein